MPQAQIWTNYPAEPDAIALVEGLATVFVSNLKESDDWPAEAAHADAIVVSSTTHLTREVMDRLSSRLRVIARPGIGVDRIDLDAATQRGIMVLNTPDGPTESTAEHAVALMLNLCKQVMVGDRILRSEKGFPRRSTLQEGLEIQGATLGLVGLGRLGGRVPTRARALGMRVLAFDPFIVPERADELGVELVPSLTELLPQAQVVSIHCPSTPETYHLMNTEMLRLMPQGSYLVNVSRGALVDEDALYEALYSGHLAGAGLDVFDPEPPAAGHPLFSLPTTICTPHIGSHTGAGNRKMYRMVYEQVAGVLRGERPANLVNRDVWGRQRT
jgi:D-3-phosphoglycerate dehydrogenase / 2-oxoglutarate reductase